MCKAHDETNRILEHNHHELMRFLHERFGGQISESDQQLLEAVLARTRRAAHKLAALDAQTQPK